jgi:hypothetical protein
MKISTTLAAAAAIAFVSAPSLALAFADCPAGVTCTELKAQGKNGGFFRVAIPSSPAWDGDLVIINHGFDLNDKKIRHHETCSHDYSPCESDVDCGSGNFCNDISYLGLDELLLNKGKAVAAGTYSASGWAVFESSKDLKDIITFVRKSDTYGDSLKRVIVTGFSLGGAVTGDAILKLKIDGAVPLCAAVGGGLPTWDVATDVRLVYDFLCDDVPGAKFNEAPDFGILNGGDSGADSVEMAFKVHACFGVLGTPSVDQQARLDKFLEITQFSGYQGPSAGINVATAMGFATLGLGDFVRDPERLDGKRIGFNIEDGVLLDYASIGTNPTLAAEYAAAVEPLEKGKGRSKLKKASWPDFTKGKGSKVEYPILSMAGAGDWLVIPEFEEVFTTALEDGNKPHTWTWIDTFGHCVFTPEEVTAVFNEYFDWIGNVEGAAMGTQPTRQDVENACVAAGGVVGDTCNFNLSFEPGKLFDRIPARSDWPHAATH